MRLEPIQGSIRFRETGDGGDICRVNGLLLTSVGFAEASYISMFGGAVDYWGNADEEIESRILVSHTLVILHENPPITANLPRLVDAVERDHAWMLADAVASSVDVGAVFDAINRVRIDVNVSAVGEQFSFSFTRNWEASVTI